MKVLLTTVRTSPGGGESRTDQEHDSAAITIGRDANQHVHVPDLHVALKHGRIIAIGKGRYQLEVLSANGIVVNGRRQQDCQLGVGDQIRLGGMQISILLAPPGFDLSLEVRRVKPMAESMDRLPHGAVLASGPAIRLMSWLLFLLLLALGLGFPLNTHFSAIPGPGQQSSLLPGTDIWLPGPLASAHEFFGHDCKTCHQRPFQPVADDDCTSCHTDMALHLPEPVEGLLDPAAEACKSCHLEHSGAADLISTSLTFCADCHHDTSAFTGLGPASPAATDFANEHPAFNVSMTRIDIDGHIEFVRLPLAEARSNEASNLLFPHDVHLDPAGVDAPSGAVVMQCADCHQANEGGRMKPISFEAHCKSCHQLAFDLSAPEREVPHGDPAAAVSVLTEFYAELALRGSSEEVLIESLAPASADESLAWARIQAEQAATALFEDRVCMQCHDLQRSEDQSAISWTIPPVHLKQSWFPAAGFFHHNHEQSECTDCHQAQDSALSSDVLIPDINICRDCHGGEDADRSFASPCVSCHLFHAPGRTEEAVHKIPATGTLILDGLPDLELQGREIRGVDPRRRRPEDGS